MKRENRLFQDSLFWWCLIKPCFELHIFLKLPCFLEMYKRQWNVLQQKPCYQHPSTGSNCICELCKNMWMLFRLRAPKNKGYAVLAANNLISWSRKINIYYPKPLQMDKEYYFIGFPTTSVWAVYRRLHSPHTFQYTPGSGWLHC